MNRSELPSLGSPCGGGFFLGEIARMEGGMPHAIVGAPKAEGETIGTPWAATGHLDPAMHWRDGLLNTAALADAGSPVAQWVRALRIGGRDDWQIPAAGPLELAYRNAHLLPIEESFFEGLYWSSTQDDSRADMGIAQIFVPGDGHLDTVIKTTPLNVRAIRLVPIVG